jgi:hypothetical protein
MNRLSEASAQPDRSSCVGESAPAPHRYEIAIKADKQQLVAHVSDPDIQRAHKLLADTNAESIEVRESQVVA